MTKFKVIFKQVFMKNIKSPAYLTMILMPVLLLGVVFGIGKIIDQSQTAAKIAVVGQAPESAAIRQLKGTDYTVKPAITTVKQAKQALEKEQIDGYLTVDQQAQITYYQQQASHDFDPSTLQNQINQLQLVTLAEAANVPTAQIKQLMTPTTVKTVTVSVEDGQQKIAQSQNQDVTQMISLGITVLMFVFIVNYAGIIAQEIATEKGSRIMEIILSSVSATTQFFAKVGAILALVLTQIGVYLVIGLVGYQFLKQQVALRSILKQVTAVIWTPPIWYAIAFLVVGVLLYTIIAAMLGSVVSRMDQVQQAISPLIIMGTLSYMGGFVLMSHADIPILKILSYVPLFSQIMLPVRFANGDISAMAAGLGLGLAIVALVGLTYLALIIYRMNVLVYSDSGVLKSFMRSFTLLKAEQK